MIRLFFYYLLFIIVTSSCSQFRLNYPYAENNTTIDTIYDVEIEDDYKWLEIDHEGNEKWLKWKTEQKKLTENFLKGKNSFIRSRIHELNSIPLYIPIEIIDKQVYYFRINVNTNQTDLYAFNLESGDNAFLKDLGRSLRSLSRLKASVSMEGNKFAVVNKINDFQNTLLVYDLDINSDKCDTIHHVRAYKPLWYNNKVHFVNDAFNSNDYGNQICSYDINTKKREILYEGAMESIFNSLDISIDRINDQLYITDNTEDLCNTYSIDLKNNSAPELIHSMLNEDGYNWRMGGSDGENIFYIKHDKYFRANVISYDIATKNMISLYKDSVRQLSEFNQVKGHLILSYKNMKDNKAVLINIKDLSRRKINVIKEGMFTFVNNKQDTALVFSEQSFTQPKSLNGASISNPDYRYKIIEPSTLPFNPDDFVSEHITIKSETGRHFNMVLSHKKGIELNGKNPAIVFFYPNSTPISINSFHFSRIMYMEQGFIFVQRSYEEYAESFSIEDKQKDMRSVLKYLEDMNYSKKEYISLSGYEYGASVAAKTINDDPSICKAVILTNGIFDFVHHPIHDKIRYHNKKLFDFQNKEELESLLLSSPYHNIQRGKDYPAILALYGEDYKTIDPAHTYKYIAKLQMRTKGDNPILMLPHIRMELGDTNVVMYDYKDHVLQVMNFLSEIIGVELSVHNISR